MYLPPIRRIPGDRCRWSENLLHGDLTRHGKLRIPAPLRVHTSINFAMPMPLPRAGKRKKIRDGLPQLLPLQGQGVAGRPAGVRSWPTISRKGLHQEELFRPQNICRNLMVTILPHTNPRH
jgi:hypothetical protein